jgi:hypothetical protein
LESSRPDHGRSGARTPLRLWRKSLARPHVARARAAGACSHSGQQRLEPLWSPVVATHGNRSQSNPPRLRHEQAKTVADDRHRLPKAAHGKGGGRRFESARGLCKSAARRRFSVQLDLLQGERAMGMEPFMELSGSKASQFISRRRQSTGRRSVCFRGRTTSCSRTSPT